MDISQSVELPKNHDERVGEENLQTDIRGGEGTVRRDKINHEPAGRARDGSDLRERAKGVSSTRGVTPLDRAGDRVAGDTLPSQEHRDLGGWSKGRQFSKREERSKDANQDSQRAESLTAARMMIRDMNPAYSKLLSQIEQLKSGQIYKSDPSLEPNSGKVLGGVLSQKGLCRGAKDFRMGTEGKERRGTELGE